MNVSINPPAIIVTANGISGNRAIEISTLISEGTARLNLVQTGSYYSETDAAMAVLIIPDNVTVITRMPSMESVDQVAVAGELSWWKRTTPPTSQPYFTTSGGVVWTQVGYRESEVLSTLHSAMAGAYGSVRNFASRADVLTWIGLNPAPAVGSVLNWGGLAVRFVALVVDVISDMAGYVPNGDPYPNHWKENTAPGTTDMTLAVLAQWNWLSVTLTGAKRGGDAKLRGEVYAVGNLTLPSRVFIEGEGRGASILRALPGTTGIMMLVGVNTDLCGWSGVAFDGNHGNATLTSVIEFEEQTLPSTGGAFQPWVSDKADNVNGQTKYKSCTAFDFVVGNCSGDGIKINPSSYQVFFDNYTVSYARGHGQVSLCADCLFTNFYFDTNFFAGLYASGSNNKYVNGKSVFSGRGDNTFGDIYVAGDTHQFLNVEAQDGYSHGWNIGGSGHQLRNTSSNANGRKSFALQNESSRIHSGYHFRAGYSGLQIQGRAYSYKTAVGDDGFWLTERPYSFDSFDQAGFESFDIQYDATKYNSKPDYLLHGKRGKGGNFWTLATLATGAVTHDFSAAGLTDTDTLTYRFNRNSPATSASWAAVFYVPGTSTIQHSLNNGDTLLNANAGDCQIGNGAFDGRRLKLGGTYRFWVDAGGSLRSHTATPSADTDGYAYQRQQSVSSTNLNSIASSINTTGKFAGKMVWASTVSRPVFAAGSTAASLWVYADGTTAYTPV